MRGLIRPALMTPRSPRATASYGPRVVRWVKRRLGMTMDVWQEYAVNRVLEHDAEGNLIAKQALVSVGRQNGKSVIVRGITGWLLDAGWKLPAFEHYKHMTMAAHDANQARIPYDLVRRDVLSFTDMQGFGVSARRYQTGRQVMRATMYGGIELNGIVLMTASNRADSGRGHTNGLIAFDEVLTQRDFDMHSVLVPSLSAVPNSLLLMTSTAGFADSVVLRSYYNQLYAVSVNAQQADDTFVGMWWMADDDDVGMDEEQLGKANPSLASGRLSLKSLALEHAILPTGNWIRERLNRWADERVDAPFSLAAWGRCRVREPLAPASVSTGYVVGVDVVPSLAEGTIVVAAQRDDGKVGVEVHRHMQGRLDLPLTANQVLSEIARLATKIKVDAIVYPAACALAPAFERHAVESGLPYKALQGPKQAQACADFAEAVTSGRLAHDDPYLDSQIAGAQRRFIGQEGAWRWAISGAPATGTVAATLASMEAARTVAPVQIFI